MMAVTVVMAATVTTPTPTDENDARSHWNRWGCWMLVVAGINEYAVSMIIHHPSMINISRN